MQSTNQFNKLLISPVRFPKISFVVPEKRFGLLSDEDKMEYEIKAKVTAKKHYKEPINA